MSNYYLIPMTHWLEMDLYSTEELDPAAKDAAVQQIRLNIQNYLKKLAEDEYYYSVNIHLYSNTSNTHIFHLTADLQVFSFKHVQGAFNPSPGNDKVSQGGIKSPPQPPGPPIIDTKILHPIINQFVLTTMVNSIFSKGGLATFGTYL